MFWIGLATGVSLTIGLFAVALVVLALFSQDPFMEQPFVRRYEN